MTQFPANIDLSSLDGNNGFKLSGVAGDFSGRSVASAGDVNGDGFADLIVGAVGATSSSSGASYVVFGKGSGFAPNIDLFSLNGSNGFMLSGAATNDHSGFSVASAGDVNGDGFADLIVGARDAGPNGTFSGASYVVFGKGSGFPANINLSSLNGSNGFRLNGVAAWDFSGSSVASAGDVNGDGFADLIVGAPDAQNGTSYVVFGKGSGFPANIDLSSLDGNNGFRLSSLMGDDHGRSVASAGDVNGDGFADLIVGTESDASYVVFGKASGFAPNIDLSSLNGSNGFKLSGDPGTYSGWSVASAGDVNGDGFADLIVGAPHPDPYGMDSGASYVVFGKASGFAPNIDLRWGLNGSNGFKLSGDPGTYSGTSVASAGDVNGDGFADLIVGANHAGPHGTDSGASYVVFGKASGFAPNIDLSSLDGNNGFKLSGVAAGEQSGFSVASAGDVNGDGFADLIVGTYRPPPNGGASYVIYGRAPDTTVNLIGTAASQTLTGGTFDDTLFGGAGNDHLFGHDGNDTLDGGVGADVMAGGQGNDVYYIDNAGDVATENSGEGTDTVYASVNYSLSAGSEIEFLRANAGATGLTLTGNELANTIVGGSGSDILSGGGGNDSLNGGAGNDTLNGAGGNDVLNGGAGADVMAGGQGNDVYYVDNAGDVATESPGEGSDTVDASVNYSLSAGSEIEFLRANAGATGLTLTGNELANTIVGGSGSDILSGGGGNDSLNGGAGNDTLNGAGGNDVLNGGAGADVMAGGQGNDVYYVDNAGDVVTENAGESTDTVYASINYTLTAGSEIEFLRANAGGTGLTLTGNELANTIVGGTGNDTLVAGAGNDTLNGGAGSDIMLGGAGNDTYFVDNTADVVNESIGDGTDTVLANVSYTLAAGTEVEVLKANASTGLKLTGNAYSHTLVGNIGNDTLVAGAGNDALNGGAGSDIMVGGAGNDTYFVDNAADVVNESVGAGTDTVLASVNYTLAAGTEVEVLKANASTGLKLTGNASSHTIVGGAGNDTLVGGAGNDTLNGGAGADTMIGGTGNDTYFVDNTADVVNESVGAGTDTVLASVSYTLAAGTEVEVLKANASTGLKLTGNASSHTIVGGAGNDTLVAGVGNDTLNGGAGADTMIGGTGNDTYFVDNTADVVTENAGEGTDTVFASVNYSLSAGSRMEFLRASAGATGLSLTGNEQANTLVGGAGNDTLNGGLGNDTLVGGAGSDVFSFVGSFGQDIINDFATHGLASADLLDFSALGITKASFTASVKITAGAGGSTMLAVGSDSIRLLHVAPTGLDVSDFRLAT